MENASRAIIMAGGILLTLVIVSILVLVFNHIGTVYIEEGDSLTVEQMEKYNRQFHSFDRSLYGSELLSLANLIDDYNRRLLYNEGESGKYYEENKFDVYVSLYRDIEPAYDDETGKVIFEGLKAKNNAPIDYIKKYNDRLESRIASMEAKDWDKRSNENYSNYSNVKSLLTELRNMPFICISNDELKGKYEAEGYKNLRIVDYNKYGRIKVMSFVQIYDEDIQNDINNRY